MKRKSRKTGSSLKEKKKNRIRESGKELEGLKLTRLQGKKMGSRCSEKMNSS